MADIPGNATSTQSLAIGTSAFSAIDFPGDNDWWKVDLRYGFQYQVWIEGSTNSPGTLVDPYLGVYSGNGTFAFGNDDASFLSFYSYATVIPSSDGFVFLSAAENGNNATGSYTITIWQDELASTSSAATVPVNSVSGVGHIGWQGDTSDWYAVTLTAGVQYQFDMIGSAGEGASVGLTLVDSWLALRSSTGAALLIDDDSGLGSNSRLFFTPSLSGTYYLDAEESGSNAYGTYRLLVNSTPTVGALAFGAAQTGAIDFIGDADLYSISLTAGVCYTFEANGTTLSDPYIELLDSSGATITQDDDRGPGMDAYLPFVPTTTGTYYVAVREAGNNATGSYALTVATPLLTTLHTSGDSVVAAITAPGEMDWFSVTLTAGVTYQFSLKGSATGDGTLTDPFLELYSPSGLPLWSSDDGGIGKNSLINFTPSSSGTYLLTAQAFGAGTGTYELLTLPNDGSPATGVPQFSGNTTIDALTHGYGWVLGASRTLTWGLADSGTWSWTSPQQSADQIAAILASVEAVANIHFEYAGYFSGASGLVNAGVAGVDISITFDAAFFSSANTWGRSNFPSTAAAYNPYPYGAGDILLNPLSAANGLSYEPGSAGYFLILHELGHTLGLKHPHDDGGTGHPTFAQAGIPASLDTDWVTVMSYEDDYNWNLTAWDPATPMVFDVLALQYLYGANTATNPGNSTYPLLANSQYQTIWDAGGVDVVDASGSSFGWDIFLSLSGSNLGSAMRHDEVLLSSQTTLYWLMGGIENIVGSDQADEIHGNAPDNVLLGNGGSDSLEGGAGNDVMYGGTGNDKFDAGGNAQSDFVASVRDGNDTMYGGLGDDTYVVSGLDQVIELAGEGVDLIWTDQSWSLSGTPFVENLSLFGSSAANITGNDNTYGNVLIGNSADNRINGGAGNDTLIGGAGNDTLDGGADIDWANYSDAGVAVTVNLALGTATGLGADTLIAIENVFGSAYADALTGDANDNYLNGGDGADTFVGGSGNDKLLGGGGDDQLDGGAGTDWASYGSSFGGAVTVNLALGTATGQGLDTLTGIENVEGGWLADIITGDANDNRLAGGKGNDSLDGGGGNDQAVFTGSRANYTLSRTAGVYTVTDNVGMDGTDSLVNVEQLVFSDLTLAVDTTAPHVSTFSPSDEAAGIAIGSNIIVTFDEAIAQGIGNIVLKTAAGVTVATYAAATSTSLAISGNVLTINPTIDLSYSTSYSIEFAAGSVMDLAGNSYAGTTSYNFTTADRVNSAPTGLVTISGVTEQGRILTASNALADADGLGNISYQWSAGGTAISGATSNNFVLTQAEVGKSITVAASYIDGLGKVESVVSSASANVANIDDTATGTLMVTGDAQESGTLVASLNSVVDVDGATSVAYQWQENIAGTWSNLSGQAAASLSIPSDQSYVGKSVRVVATTTDALGGTTTFAGAAQSIANINDLPTGSVTVTGTPTQSETLTASNTLADADGMGTINYQWKADGAPILGATGNTLVLAQAQVGKGITVVASYIDGFGTSESVIGGAGKMVDLLAYTWRTHTLLDAVSVSGAGQSIATTTSGAATLTAVVEPSVSLTVSRPVPSVEASATSSAVNLQDAIAILKMIVGLPVNGANQAISPYQTLAADFDANGSVGLTDAIGVLKHVVGLAAPDPTWHLVNEADTSVPSKTTLSPGTPQATVTADLSGISPVRVGLVGYLSGDVDGSYAGAAGALDLDVTQPAYIATLVASHPGLTAAQFGG